MLRYSKNSRYLGNRNGFAVTGDISPGPAGTSPLVNACSRCGAQPGVRCFSVRSLHNLSGGGYARHIDKFHTERRSNPPRSRCGRTASHDAIVEWVSKLPMFNKTELSRRLATEAATDERLSPSVSKMLRAINEAIDTGVLYAKRQPNGRVVVLVNEQRSE